MHPHMWNSVYLLTISDHQPSVEDVRRFNSTILLGASISQVAIGKGPLAQKFSLHHVGDLSWLNLQYVCPYIIRSTPLHSGKYKTFQPLPTRATCDIACFCRVKATIHLYMLLVLLRYNSVDSAGTPAIDSVRKSPCNCSNS